ncbi:MAG TPA: aminopeptidase P N-terminal domain-containing protein [Polyangia bacterium]
MSNPFAARRQALMDRIGPRAVAVTASLPVAVRNGDVEHRFRQSGDVLYLTGFPEPETVVVVAPGRPEKLVMFVRPRDPERETWTGRRAGIEGAREHYGADAAFSIDALATELPKLLDGADELAYTTGLDPKMDEVVLKAINDLRAGERRGMRAPTRITDLRATLHELRLIKDADALDKLRRAAEITAEAHTAAMRAARGGVNECEIEALIDYTFRRRGGLTGYGTIVGGGVNATILHYVDNREPLTSGQLLLVDAGCEVDGFTADVTRTYPIGERFSPAERRAYQLVLDVEKRCIAEVRPGANIDAIHQLAVELLTAGMVELGLLSGDPKQLIESGAYKRFYMHRTSHWLGLDVHDVGAYTVDGKSRPLVPGMVLTVEPGLYVPPDSEGVPAELRGLGIRIEDDVLVTETGHEILTRAIPKEIPDLEALTTA